MHDPRIQELLDLAEAEGLTLPFSPETIIAMEGTGAVVDLMTGAILPSEADRPYHWALTPTGEAMAHLISVGLEEV